jgi:hypothetical protein
MVKFSVLTNTSFSKLLFALLVTLLLHLRKATMLVFHGNTVNARLSLEPSQSRLTEVTGKHR